MSLTATNPAGHGGPPDGAAAGRPLPMSRARWAALLIGVPACLFLIANTGFNLVATLGQASYPVSYVAPAGTTSLRMNASGGALTLQPSDGREVTVTGTARYSLVRSDLSAGPVPGGGAAVSYSCAIWVGECGLDATVGVPRGLPATVSSDGGDLRVTGTTGPVTLSTGGGDITASHLSGPATLKTDGGTIQATAVTTTDLIATSGGGDITVSQVTGRDVTLRTDGGNVMATTLDTPTLWAGSGGGDIQIAFASVPQHVTVDTSGGNITILVPPGATQYHVSAHTDGGSVTDSVPQNTSSKYEITATSGGGDITIRQAP